MNRSVYKAEFGAEAFNNAPLGLSHAYKGEFVHKVKGVSNAFCVCDWSGQAIKSGEIIYAISVGTMNQCDPRNFEWVHEFIKPGTLQDKETENLKKEN